VLDIFSYLTIQISGICIIIFLWLDLKGVKIQLKDGGGFRGMDGFWTDLRFDMIWIRHGFMTGMIRGAWMRWIYQSMIFIHNILRHPATGVQGEKKESN